MLKSSEAFFILVVSGFVLLVLFLETGSHLGSPVSPGTHDNPPASASDIGFVSASHHDQQDLNFLVGKTSQQLKELVI